MRDREWRMADGSRASLDSSTRIGGTGPGRAAPRAPRRKGGLSDEQVMRDVAELIGLNDQAVELAMHVLQSVASHVGVVRGARRMALRAACLSLAGDKQQAQSFEKRLCASHLWRVSPRALRRQKKAVLYALHDLDRRLEHRDEWRSLYTERVCEQLGFDGQLALVMRRRVHRLAADGRLASRPSKCLVASAVMHLMLQTGVPLVRMSTLSIVVGCNADTMHKWYALAYNMPVHEVRTALRALSVA